MSFDINGDLASRLRRWLPLPQKTAIPAALMEAPIA
jgi:hypothetical protein